MLDYDFVALLAAFLLISLTLTIIALGLPIELPNLVLLIASGLGSGWVASLPTASDGKISMGNRRYIGPILVIFAAFFIFNSPDWHAATMVVGGCLEVVGVFFMANSYLDLPKHEAFTSLISAFWCGEWAKDAAATVIFNEDRALISLQGLSFIGLGFMLQALASLLTLFFPELNG